MEKTERRIVLTFKELGRIINTEVSIPARTRPFHLAWYLLGIQFLDSLEYPVLGTETDNNFRYAQQERLNPKFVQLPFELYVVCF